MYQPRFLNTSLLIILLIVFTIDVFAINDIELPFPCNKSYSVTQGNNNSYSHTGYGKYAFDLNLQIGDVVTAVAPGKVTKIKENSNTHCYPDTTCPGTANYVLIDHYDGTSSVYLHLKQWSVNVEVGEIVITGQPIGQVGLTGRTSGPHLHFQLQETCGSYWCQSVEVRFKDIGIPQRYDVLGDTCTCPNGYTNISTCHGNNLRLCIHGSGVDKYCTNCVGMPSGTHDVCEGEIISVGTVDFLQPESNEVVDNPVRFRADVSGDVVTVKYSAGGWPLGESSDADNNFKVEYNFHEIGLREVIANGYDANDNLIPNASKTINIEVIEAGSGTANFISPLNNRDVANPVLVTSRVSGDVTNVKYYADNRFLWAESSNSGNSFRASKLFDTIGTRELNVRGYNSSGIRITGAEHDITVNVLEEVACNDECGIGQKICEGSNIKTCMTDNNGCKVWGAANSCGANKTCQNNSCVETCQNECNTTRIYCSGNKVKKCANTDSDSCLELSTIQTCSSDEVCENGTCVDTNNCTDKCNNIGEKICNSSGYIVECVMGSNNCKNWSSPVACSPNQTCQDGNCIVSETCQNECSTSGARSCNANQVDICGNYDNDECLELKIISSCSDEETCINGECKANINHECSPEYSKKCNGDEVQICEKDGETLKWKLDKECSENQICDSGECNDTCIDRCRFGVKKCNGNNVEVCKYDFDADLCSEWGTLEECNTRGETCEDGYCEKTCWDQCDELGLNACGRDGNVYTCLEGIDSDCYELRDPIICSEGYTCKEGQCAKKDEIKEATNNQDSAADCNYNSSNNKPSIFILLIFSLFILYKKRYNLNKK